MSNNWQYKNSDDIRNKNQNGQFWNIYINVKIWPGAFSNLQAVINSFSIAQAHAEQSKALQFGLTCWDLDPSPVYPRI